MAERQVRIHCEGGLKRHRVCCFAGNTVEDLTFGADYKSNGGEAWYYDGKSWITDNLEGVTMAFELFV